MARSKVDLPPASAVRQLVDAGGRLRVRVTPAARSEGAAIVDGQLSIHTRAKPQDGAANDAAAKLVAQALGIAPSRVALLRGATSRLKTLRVDG